MIALVTGATGFIGQHLVQRLLENGTTVRVLTRHPSRVPPDWEGRVLLAIGDIVHRSTLHPAVEGVDIIYHLAGEIRNKDQFQAVNYAGTRNLLESCTVAGLTRFLYLSSIGVLGAREQGEYDEKSPCHPLNAYEKSKYLGEQVVIEYSHERKLPITVVRPTIVFGPGPAPTNDSFLGWMKVIKSGRFRFIGSDDAVANYIFIEDVVESCVHLAQEESAIGEIYHLSDPCTLQEFVKCVLEIIGDRMPGRVPAWIAYAAALTLEGSAKIGGFVPPLTLSRVRALTSRSLFLGNKLRQVFKFPVGWRKGLERTISAYRTKGLL